MSSRKTTLFSLAMALTLVAACASQPAMPPATIPVSTSDPAPTDVAIPFPTPFVPVIMLQIGFSAPQRLIPASLDPTTQAPEVISQFGQILSNQSERWYAGTIEGLHRVSLEINSLSTDPTETVRLQFPIHMIVTKTQEPVDALNIISQMGGGGGGGESRAFADFELQDGEWDLYPDNPAPLDLRADALPFAPYDFTAPCKQPGIYKLEFSIPYTLFKADGSQTFASSYYIISLACPQSAALWLWNGNPNGQIEKAGNFIFENGKYIPQP